MRLRGERPQNPSFNGEEQFGEDEVVREREESELEKKQQIPYKNKQKKI